MLFHIFVIESFPDEEKLQENRMHTINNPTDTHTRYKQDMFGNNTVNYTHTIKMFILVKFSSPTR